MIHPHTYPESLWRPSVDSLPRDRPIVDMAPRQRARIYTPLETILQEGVTSHIISKLREGGVHSVERIAMITPQALVRVKGMSEKRVEAIREAAKERLHTHSFISGTECMEKVANTYHVSTGCVAVDTILGGGIESRGVTEVYGEYRTGKTQLCHTLAVTAQMGENGGKVMYIDTQGTFRPKRLEPIAQRFGLEFDSVLENIVYARVYTHTHLMEMITPMSTAMAQEEVRLVVVDSATAPFFVDLPGRRNHSEREEKLSVYLSSLMKLSCEFNVPVLVTNQVTMDTDNTSGRYRQNKPVGENVVGHSVTTRLRFGRFLSGDYRWSRSCCVLHSPGLPEECADLQISDGGVTDIDN
ncbi:DNA recombination and repair protein, RecA-like [Kipferlia bialata]|uniref:DNA recombination and repair protein, RecA-like n=1 Tax=Kipferlia bialata TaxID=797122 RepID=A0A9K3CP70_9EUKA|nr:DNA recombination and repair protein, RecA-like [Kipferlia bialata]|eukprot:g494.t1